MIFTPRCRLIIFRRYSLLSLITLFALFHFFLFFAAFAIFDFRRFSFAAPDVITLLRLFFFHADAFHACSDIAVVRYAMLSMPLMLMFSLLRHMPCYMPPAIAMPLCCRHYFAMPSLFISPLIFAFHAFATLSSLLPFRCHAA